MTTLLSVPLLHLIVAVIVKALAIFHAHKIVG